MRLTKTKSPAVFLLAAAALCALPLAAFAQQEKNSAALDQLRQKAWAEGRAQVIVHFVVPEIEQLSAASAQFWGLDETAQIARDRTFADTNLMKAIEYASWKIIAELQGTDFEVIARFDYIPFIALRVSPTALAVLENSADVLGLEEDLPRKLIDPPGINGEGEKAAE